MLRYHDNAIPLYRQLYQDLRKKITGGEWTENQLIPPETALMKEYGVGRETVRRAVLQLVNEGYLYRRRGVGTVVCRRRPEDGLENLVSFSAEMFKRGVQPGAELLKLVQRTPPPEVAEALEISPEEELIFFRRLRRADGIPLAVEDSFILPSVINEVDPEKLSGSFYHYLVYDKEIPLGRILVEIRSVSSSEELARLLDIKKGQPLLKMIRTIYTAGEQPFFYLVFHFRGDVYSIKSSLTPSP